MRRYLLALIAVLFSICIHAQTNASEAKAAYLLAEESYGKGDYKNALEFLRQVREALGGANCKVLYLQIMATRELYANDTSVNSKVLPLIVEFEKSADYADFNEEKSLEITKIKLLFKNEEKAAIERKRKKEIADKEAVEKAFTATLNSAGPFGVSMDDLDKAKPAWNVKRWKKTDIGATQVYFDANLFKLTPENYPFPTNRKIVSTPLPITGIIVSENKIIGYVMQVLELDQEKSLYSMAYDGTKKSVLNFIDGYKGALGKDAYTTRSFSGLGNTATQMDWRKGDCGIKIISLIFPKGQAGVVKLVEMVYCDPNKIIDTLIK